MALAPCMAACGVDMGDNLETSGTLDLRATEGRGGRSLCPAGTRKFWGQRPGLPACPGVQDQALPGLTPKHIRPPCTPHL